MREIEGADPDFKLNEFFNLIRMEEKLSSFIHRDGEANSEYQSVSKDNKSLQATKNQWEDLNREYKELMSELEVLAEKITEAIDKLKKFDQNALTKIKRAVKQKYSEPENLEHVFLENINLFTEEIEPRFEDLQKQYLRCIEKTIQYNKDLQNLQKQFKEDFNRVNINVSEEIYQGEIKEIESAFKAIEFISIQNEQILENKYNIKVTSPTQELCDDLMELNHLLNTFRNEIQKVEDILEESASEIHYKDRSTNEVAEEVLKTLDSVITPMNRFNQHKLHNRVREIKD